MIRQLFTAACIVSMLSGCASQHLTTPIATLNGPPIQDTKTPYTDLLACIGNQANMKMNQDHLGKIAIAVSTIPDKTGKFNYNENGFEVTQGAEDMMVSALSETNAYTMVERNNMGVSQMEIDYANKFLLSDSNNSDNFRDKNGHVARAIRSGVIKGSDYVITGSISELNYDVGSGGFNVTIEGIGPGYRDMWMDVGMDLRVVDTKTTQIVMALPLRKQIRGYESQLGVVHLFGSTFVNATAGMQAQEPIQLAVRSIMEAAAIDITKALYHLPQDACSDVKIQVPAPTDGLHVQKDPSTNKASATKTTAQ